MPASPDSPSTPDDYAAAAALIDRFLPAAARSGDGHEDLVLVDFPPPPAPPLDAGDGDR